MSNIFNDYASREALLRDVESAIAETTDGQGNPTFRLIDRAADELRAQRDEQTRRALRPIDPKARLALYR